MHHDEHSLKNRNGFTLVELLIVISIVALLSTLMLGALYTAQDAAKAQKTRSTIAKLHTLMMQRYESYQTRRVPITIPAGTNPKQAAKLRLDALRELMRMELPDRLTDVIEITSPYNNAPATRVPIPSITRAYYRKLSTAFASKPPGATNPYKNQSSELLYMILSTPGPDDDSPLESFGQSEIADTDGNGLPEFVDAWGVPIQWIRWPSGFRSDLQTGVRADQPDPFDARQAYTNNYAIYPLIYSAGPDKIYDIKGNRDIEVSPAPIPYSDKNNDPFDPVFLLTGTGIDENGDQPGGANGESNWLDNIHNHLIGTR